MPAGESASQGPRGSADESCQHETWWTRVLATHGAQWGGVMDSVAVEGLADNMAIDQKGLEACGKEEE